MNKLTLAGIITTVIMLGATWLSVGGSKGGLNDDIVNILAVGGAVALVIITVFVDILYKISIIFLWNLNGMKTKELPTSLNTASIL